MSKNSVLALTVIAVVALGAVALGVFGQTPSNTVTVIQTESASSMPATSTPEETAAAPVATTASASDITDSTATLHGSIDPNGSPTIYWFEYSADPLLGAVLIKKTPQITFTSGGAGQVEAKIVGLTGSSTYYYRLVAGNKHGTVRGERFSFNTR
jgi:hypothetical protein